MFLSCAELDRDAPSTYRLVASPYRVHAMVEAVCCGDSDLDGEPGRNLWRLDHSEVAGDVRLFVVSPHAPSVEELCARLGVGPGAIRIRDYTSRLEEIAEGQLWAFRLKANPVRKVLVDKGSIQRKDIVGTLQAEVTMTQQVDWLIRRAESHGFVVPKNAAGESQVTVSQRRKERFARGNEMVTLATARYDGLLEVTDAELLRQTLISGLGRAKGFGCGLLTIARPWA